jgi:hypothetical protein
MKEKRPAKAPFAGEMPWRAGPGCLFGDTAIAMAAPCTYFEVNSDAFIIYLQQGGDRHA